jgi:hypothetical protein
MHYNAFTGSFDAARSSGAGRVVASVERYDELPLDGRAPVGSAWRVNTASGIVLVNRHQAGVYVRTGSAGESREADYTFVGPALSVVVLEAAA